jgi:uncharacterized iron-regulated protein
MSIFFFSFFLQSLFGLSNFRSTSYSKIKYLYSLTTRTTRILSVSRLDCIFLSFVRRIKYFLVYWVGGIHAEALTNTFSLLVMQ